MLDVLDHASSVQDNVSQSNTQLETATTPELATGGTTPELATGGTTPKLATGGTTPELATGETTPKLVTGGTIPELATGGIPPGLATSGIPPELETTVYTSVTSPEATTVSTGARGTKIKCQGYSRYYNDKSEYEGYLFNLSEVNKMPYKWNITMFTQISRIEKRAIFHSTKFDNDICLKQFLTHGHRHTQSHTKYALETTHTYTYSHTLIHVLWRVVYSKLPRSRLSTSPTRAGGTDLQTPHPK
jgi:hypothetical protein